MNGSGDPMDTDVARMSDATAADEETIVTVDTEWRIGCIADDAKPLIFDVNGVSVHYGDFPAVRDISLPIRRTRDHRLDRAVRMWEDDVPPMSESDERPDRRRPRRGHDPLSRCRPLRRTGGCGGGASADRDGVPEAQPVPEIDLRQRGLRSQDRRLQGQHGRPRRGVAPAGSALGRGEEEAEGLGDWPSREASSSVSASHGRSRRAPT